MALQDLFQYIISINSSYLHICIYTLGCSMARITPLISDDEFSFSLYSLALERHSSYKVV